MNKKYIILKKPVKKAQWGNKISALYTATGSRTPQTQGDYSQALNNAVGDINFMDPISSTQSLENALGNNNPLETNTIDTNSPLPGTESTTNRRANPNLGSAIGVGAQVTQMGSDYLFSNAMDKNSRTDSFGNEIFDKKDAKLIKKQSAVKGLTSGATTGAAIGSIIPGVGTAIGAGVGAVVGGITGLFKGKKEAEKAEDEYNEQKKRNISAVGRESDMRMSRALLGKSGTKINKKKLGSFKLPKKKSLFLVLRTGGKLETPGKVNVVVKGKLHKENNNLGNKDKGIPVIDANGVKEYEVEKGEIVFRHDTTILIEEYAAKYKETENETLLVDLGEIVTKELLENTQDNDGTFGVKVKENED